MAKIRESTTRTYMEYLRLKQYDIRLNEEKCSFSQSEIMYYGHIFTAKGIKPDPKKVDNITAMKPPQSTSEVKSLLGMAQYVSHFIPEYAIITAPLRNLTKQNVVWKWDEEEQRGTKRSQCFETSSHRGSSDDIL